MRSYEFDHAMRFRPKSYSVKVWEYIVSEAILHKTWALRTLKTDPQWVHRASDASIQMLGRYLSESTIDLAKSSYDYLKHRAFGQSYIGAVDPSARRLWEELTQKRVPPSQYWLYDHMDTGEAKHMRFIKRRWTKLKTKTKRAS